LELVTKAEELEAVPLCEAKFVFGLAFWLVDWYEGWELDAFEFAVFANGELEEAHPPTTSARVSALSVKATRLKAVEVKAARKVLRLLVMRGMWLIP